MQVGNNPKTGNKGEDEYAELMAKLNIPQIKKSGLRPELAGP